MKQDECEIAAEMYVDILTNINPELLTIGNKLTFGTNIAEHGIPAVMSFCIDIEGRLAELSVAVKKKVTENEAACFDSLREYCKKNGLNVQKKHTVPAGELAPWPVEFSIERVLNVYAQEDPCETCGKEAEAISALPDQIVIDHQKKVKIRMIEIAGDKNNDID